ncbi:MAG: response regulator transcription factor [Bryobacteraceae bacterium]|nr:response regulator transcription factor [Bryobacteraceae bacterium]
MAGSTEKKITVLLADDHRLVRLGFRRLLEDEPGIEVIGEAGNGQEAIELIDELKPDVAVVDMAMPELDGLQVIHEVRRRMPATRLLVVSMYGERNYVRNAVQAGASGYVVKNAIDVDLVSAVRAVAQGRQFFSEPITAKDLEGPEPEDPLERLTQRERQILQLIAQARSNKEIANILNISVNTVNVHRTNLMNSLNLHSTAELVLFAVKKGLVNPQ